MSRISSPPDGLLEQLKKERVTDKLSAPQQHMLVALVRQLQRYARNSALDARTRKELTTATKEAKARTQKLRSKLDVIKKALEDLAKYVQRIEDSVAGAFWMGIAESADFAPSLLDDAESWSEGDQPDWNPVPHSVQIREDAARYAAYQPGVPSRIAVEVKAVLAESGRKPPTFEVSSYITYRLHDFFKSDCGISGSESNVRTAKILKAQFGERDLRINEKATLDAQKGSETVRSRIRRAARHPMVIERKNRRK